MADDKTENYFAIALQHILEQRGRGSETVLAIDSGVSQSTINRIKSGRSFGLRSNCVKIADALGTTYDEMWLLGKQLNRGAAAEEHQIVAKGGEEGKNMVIDLNTSHKKISDLLVYIQHKNPQLHADIIGRIKATAHVLKSLDKSDERNDTPG